MPWNPKKALTNVDGWEKFKNVTCGIFRSHIIYNIHNKYTPDDTYRAAIKHQLEFIPDWNHWLIFGTDRRKKSYYEMLKKMYLGIYRRHIKEVREAIEEKGS